MLEQPSCEQQDLGVAPCICFANYKHDNNWLLYNKNIQAKSNFHNDKDSGPIEEVIEIGYMYLSTVLSKAVDAAA